MQRLAHLRMSTPTPIANIGGRDELTQVAYFISGNSKTQAQTPVKNGTDDLTANFHGLRPAAQVAQQGRATAAFLVLDLPANARRQDRCETRFEGASGAAGDRAR